MKSFNQATQSSDKYVSPIITYNFATAAKRRIAKKKVVEKPIHLCFDGYELEIEKR